VVNNNSNDPRRLNQITVGESTWIEIERGKLGLGLSLVGGSDTHLAGIIIHDIYESGAANRDKRLAIGDQIMRVNETDLTSVTHEQALAALRRQTSDTVRLLVHRSINNHRAAAQALGKDASRDSIGSAGGGGGGGVSRSNSSNNNNNSGGDESTKGLNTPSSSSLAFADLILNADNEKFLNIVSIDLNKKFGKGLGFSIIGRRDGSGVFISHIVS
jgi:hypothetical protein